MACDSTRASQAPSGPIAQSVGFSAAYRSHRLGLVVAQARPPSFAKDLLEFLVPLSCQLLEFLLELPALSDHAGTGYFLGRGPGGIYERQEPEHPPSVE